MLHSSSKANVHLSFAWPKMYKALMSSTGLNTNK